MRRIQIGITFRAYGVRSEEDEYAEKDKEDQENRRAMGYKRVFRGKGCVGMAEQNLCEDGEDGRIIL